MLIKVISLFKFSACRWFFTLALIWVSAAGCRPNSGSSGTSGETQPQEAAKALQDVCKEAKPEIKAAVDQIAGAIQDQAAPRAFLQLQQLSARTDLTPEQSMAAARAIASVRAQLAAAAARGDKAAAEMLEMYRSTT